MSLNIGTLVESHLSMICPQTTHLAILPSLVKSREYVTAYRAPQCGQKKLRPSGIAPVGGIGTPPNSRLSCSLKKINSRRVRSSPLSSRVDRHACFIVKDKNGYPHWRTVFSLCVAPRFEPGQASFA